MIKEFPMTEMSVFTAPIEKMMSLNVAKFEAAVEKQTAAAKELAELAEARTKAFTEIKDFDGFSAFMKDQSTLAKDYMSKAVTESKETMDEAKAYGEEVKKIYTDYMDSVFPAAKKAVKKS